MTSPNLSVLHGGEPAASLAPTQDATAQLNLHGPVQVHVHLGRGVPAAGHAVSSTPPRRHPALWAALGLALAAGGYLAGSRTAGAPVHADTGGAALADALPPPPSFPLPVLPAPPLPAQPARPGDLVPALQQQLARPGVVTPPPGAAAVPPRNPFGLGN